MKDRVPFSGEKAELELELELEEGAAQAHTYGTMGTVLEHSL